MSLQDEMMIIIGGWRDARRQAIEEEVMGLLDRLGVKDQLRSIAVPHVRSSSASQDHAQHHTGHGARTCTQKK